MNLMQPKSHKTNVGDKERLFSTILGGLLALYGLRKRSFIGGLLTFAGGDLIYRGFSGVCHIYRALGINTAEKQTPAAAVVEHNEGVKIEKTIVIEESLEELYRFWRNFENLPRFMSNLESVTVFDEKFSHWVVKGPAGMEIQWDAEVYNEIPNELIAWRTMENADVNHAGSVHFKRLDGRGTEVRIVLNYEPPAGKVGDTFAKMIGESPEQQVEEDLRRLKEIFKTREVPTSSEP